LSAVTRHVLAEQDLLAKMGDELAATLDLEQTCRRANQWMLRGLGDVTVLRTVDERGRVQQVQVAARDESRFSGACLDVLTEVWRAGGRRSIFAARRPLVQNDLTPEYLESLGCSDRQRRALRQLGPGAMMLLPLRAHGRVVGDRRAEPPQVHEPRRHAAN
jgi:hypothetical protein